MNKKLIEQLNQSTLALAGFMRYLETGELDRTCFNAKTIGEVYQNGRNLMLEVKSDPEAIKTKLLAQIDANPDHDYEAIQELLVVIQYIEGELNQKELSYFKSQGINSAVELCNWFGIAV